jgi:phosphatidate phosphatase LPIN
MQYVRSLGGQVSKTWNSINPATLSGAIDVIVIEQDDGSLACSPFHVRFGKFSLLRPYEKKVEFQVNNVKQNYSMKLGEGGEAFFVFETTENIPEALQTSPLISPASSPSNTVTDQAATPLIEPTYLDITENGGAKTGLTPTGSPGKSGTPCSNEEPMLASSQPSPYGVNPDGLSIDLSTTSLP